MARTNSQLISKLLDTWYNELELKKTAQKKEDEGPVVEQKEIPDPTSQGEAGSEKQDDRSEVPGVAADSEKAKNKPVKPVSKKTGLPESEQPQHLEADEPINEGANKVKVSEQVKIARAGALGDAILRRIQGLKKTAGVAPSFSNQTFLEKVASANPALYSQIYRAFEEHTAGFLRGLEQKRADVESILRSGLVKTAEEAEKVVEDVAATEPEKVLPPEVIQDIEAAKNADVEAVLDTIADDLAAQGVTPEDLMQAAEVVTQLEQAGFTPEEIAEAAQEMAAEVAGAEAAKEVQAAYRDTLSKYIKGLRR